MKLMLVAILALVMIGCQEEPCQTDMECGCAEDCLEGS
jgi:hypothetical protein